MELLKVHGSGNTFYLHETENENAHDYVKLTKWLCAPENDGGADGLLLVCPSSKGLAKMRVINADGSEASMCGNGLRCVARYVCEKHNVSAAHIETMKAVLYVKQEAPIFEQLPTYSVEINPISFELSSLPMAYEQRSIIQHQVLEQFDPNIHYTAISVPNPHLIGIVERQQVQNSAHQFLLAHYLNGDNPFCPDGVNVSYVYPMSTNEIYVRTYERGVGFTNACGTAMTASAYVASLYTQVEAGEVTVYNPGGFVKCAIEGEGHNVSLRLIGNATILYSANLEEVSYTISNKQYTDEQQQYKNLVDYVSERINF